MYYKRKIKKSGCLAAILITGCLSIPVFAEESQPLTEEILTEKETEPINDIAESLNSTEETVAQTEALSENQTEAENDISMATESSKQVTEPSEEVMTSSNWKWDDKENVIQNNTIDVVCKNENYMLTYQNFSACLPEKIILDETEDVSIKEWQCKEVNLEPGTELLSLHRDSLHLSAVFDKQYKLNPDPLLTIRFLKLTPTGKFTGKETGIWKWIIKNN